MPTYHGSCHCGKVQYDVDMELNNLISCNCSICSKKGYILGFAGEEQFKLLSGENDLTDYQFNKKTIHHLFCKHCGVGSFGHGQGPDGSRMYAINVRCLEQVDISRLNVTPVDGKSV